MGRGIRVLTVSLGIIVGIPIVAMLISWIISSPYSGEELAKEKGFRYPLVIAHRGASELAPENTVASFTLARELGADYVETDVQRTKDGVLIVFHDDDPERTTSVKQVFPGREKEPIGSFTYQELRQLEVGSWFNTTFPARARKKFAELRIPTFEEYIDALTEGDNRPGLFIELKNPANYPGVEQQIVDVLIQRGILDDNAAVVVEEPRDTRSVASGLGKRRVVFLSFDEDSLFTLQRIAPAVTRLYVANESDAREKGGFGGLVETAVQLDAELGPVGYMAWPWNARQAHGQNRLFFVWTIDKDIHIRLISFFGADGLITNRCHRYLEYLGRGVMVDPQTVLSRYN